MAEAELAQPTPTLPQEQDEPVSVGFLPLSGLSDSHISCRVFGMRKTPTSPLPLWERAFGLSAAGSLRPRRLGRKGEGWDLACSLEHGCLFMRRPVPHQVCLGSQARQGKPSSPIRERRRRRPAPRQFRPRRDVCIRQPLSGGGTPRRGLGPSSLDRVRAEVCSCTIALPPREMGGASDTTVG